MIYRLSESSGAERSLSSSAKSTALAGIAISVLVIAAVASIGYFQFKVAPSLFTSPSISSTSALLPGKYVNVTIPNNAGTPPQGYTSGAKTTFGFSPDTITVVIGKNNTVQWINNDTAVHTATSDTAGIFDTGTIPSGGSASFTFTTPGTYTYHCSFHAWMQGTIIVKSG